MAFRRYRRVRTGKYSWQNIGKTGSSTTIKYGNRTTTQSSKGLKSTYRYADGLSQSSYISNRSGSRRKGRGRRNQSGIETLFIAIGLVGFLAFTYPAIAALVAIVCVLVVAFIWWPKDENNASALTETVQSFKTDEELDNEEDMIDEKDQNEERTEAKQSREKRGGPESEAHLQVQGKARRWFEVLRVSPGASRKDIKAARDNLARIYHSDRFSSVRLKLE